MSDRGSPDVSEYMPTPEQRCSICGLDHPSVKRRVDIDYRQMLGHIQMSEWKTTTLCIACWLVRQANLSNVRMYRVYVQGGLSGYAGGLGLGKIRFYRVWRAGYDAGVLARTVVEGSGCRV